MDLFELGPPEIPYEDEGATLSVEGAEVIIPQEDSSESASAETTSVTQSSHKREKIWMGWPRKRRKQGN